MYDVDHTAELVAFPYGKLRGDCVVAEDTAYRIDGLVEIGVLAVHPVHNGNARKLAIIGVSPSQLGAHLNAGNCVNQHHRCIGDAQRAHDFSDEVGVSRSIYEVDFVTIPLHGRD